MLGDTEIEPSSPQSTFQPVSPAPVATFSPKHKQSILPLIFGFLLVIVLSAVIGIVYYKNKLTTDLSPSTTPTPTIIASTEPSLSPSSTASSSPKSSSKTSPSPTSKPSVKPSPTLRPSIAPTPTPVPLPTLDIRFGNPSANIKQTYDDGSGVGRVINREYTSIQAGQFDEVTSSWSPRVTVCFHVVSNETISGKDLKFSFTLDDKVEAEETLSQYDKLEAGRLYDWCHDVTSNIGKHTVKLLLNGDKSLKEINFTNDLARLDWENLSDKIAPNFTLLGPNNEGTEGTCLFPQYVSDNVTSFANLKIDQKIDSNSWVKFGGSRYCFAGTSGSSHTFAIKITDERGNANEQSKTFVLY